MAKLHARFWKYDGNHPSGHNCERYDPHGFGLDLISTMAYVADNWNMSYSSSDSEIGQILKQQGGNLDGVVVNHRKGDGFGHQVHVAATAEQWKAMQNAQRIYEEGMASQYANPIDENGQTIY
jgi:hypothetical protein